MAELILAERLLLTSFSPETGFELPAPFLSSGPSTLRPTVAAAVIADLIEGGHAALDGLSPKPFLAADAVLLAKGPAPAHPMLAAAHGMIAGQSKRRRLGRYLSLLNSETEAKVRLHRLGLLASESSGSRRWFATAEGRSEAARSRWEVDEFTRPGDAVPAMSPYVRRFAAFVAAGPLWERLWKEVPAKQRAVAFAACRAVGGELVTGSPYGPELQAVLAALTTASTYSG